MINVLLVVIAVASVAGVVHNMGALRRFNDAAAAMVTRAVRAAVPSTAGIKIAVLNHLGPTYSVDIARMAEVLQKYADLVCDAHGWARVVVQFMPQTIVAPDGWTALGLFENPDVSGALGYHDLDPKGRPYGKCFLSVVPGHIMLRDPNNHGASLAGVATHELGELLGNFYANLYAFGAIKDPGSNRVFNLMARELADPVQDCAFLLTSSDNSQVDCSDFVLPGYFNPDSAPTDATSYTGAARGPFVIVKGGYAIVAKLTSETQVMARLVSAPPTERLFHPDAPPPAWREAARAIDTRGSRIARAIAAA